MLSNLFLAGATLNEGKPTLPVRSSAAVAPLVIPTASHTRHSAKSPSSPMLHHSASSPAPAFTFKLGANRIPRPSSSSSSSSAASVSSRATTMSSLSITIPTTPSSTPSTVVGSASSSYTADRSSISASMLIASAARAAGDLSLAPVAHSPSRASPTSGSASASFKSSKWAAAHSSDLLVHGGSSDLDDQIDRLNASIRLALHWAVNTAIQPHTRRLYYEYRPPVVGTDVTSGMPPVTSTFTRYPVMVAQVPAGAGGRVLRRDAVAELQSLFRLYMAFLTVPPSDPVAQRSFSFSIRSILSFYTDLLTPLPLSSPTTSSHLHLPAPLASATPLTLDDRALQEPCSTAALAALLDLLTLIRHAPLPRTQFASTIDDPAWVDRTADGLALTLVLLSNDARWLPAYVPSTVRAYGGTQRAPSVDDSRAVLDALCALARYVGARAATGCAEDRAVAVVVGSVVRKVARTHLDLCAPAASAATAGGRRRQVSSLPGVHVHGGDWDPASVMDFDDEEEEPVVNKKRPSSPHAHAHAHRHDSTSPASDSDSDADASDEDTYTSERVAIAVRVTRLALLLHATDPDVVDDAIAHWDALSAAHYFVPLTVVAAHPTGAARKHATYQYSTAELARIVESLTQLLPHLDPVRRAMLKSPLAAATRELANRQVVRGADRLAVGGFVCRAMTTAAVAAPGAGPRWVSSPLAGRASASAAGAGATAKEECQAHHVPIIAEAIGALVVVVKGLSERVASGTGSPGSWRDDEARVEGRARAWSPPLV